MIRIIAGIYGYRPAPGAMISPKKPGDPPFELTPEKEARLVELHVAEYVGPSVAEDWKPDVGPSNDPGDDGGNNIPYYDADMKLAALKEIAEAHGISTRSMRSKAEVVAALDAVFRSGYEDPEDGDPEDENDGWDDGEDEDPDSEAPPDLRAEDPQP